MSAATTASYPHVTVDDHGVARVYGTRLKLTLLVGAKQAWNLSPEDMVEQFPPLTLAAVHSALAYYYDHQAKLDEQIARDREYAETMRPMLDNAELRAKLQAYREARNVP